MLHSSAITATPSFRALPPVADFILPQSEDVEKAVQELMKYPYFLGIIIRMFYDEHNPPHFHAEYQGQRASFDLDGNLIRGRFKSNTAKSLIKKWAKLHQKELTESWDRARRAVEIRKIDPLD